METIKKKCNVVILSNEWNENIKPPFISRRQDKYSDLDDYLTYQTNNIDGRDNPKHLYITSDDKIKIGDWFLHYNDSSYLLFQCTETNNKKISHVDKLGNKCSFLSPNRQFKIIATTDDNLRKMDDAGIIDIAFGEKMPQVQQSFLKEYVSNPDRKWEVEYNIIKNGVCMPGCNCKEDCLMIDKISLKLNQDNTVNITAVEEKMYSKKEVESLIRLAMQSKDYTPEYEVQNFVKKYL